MKDQETERPRS